MLLRILLISDNAVHSLADLQLLKDRGLQVYTCCNYNIVSELVREIKPDVIFIDPEQAGKKATALYHSLLDNILFASIPVIYALVEDDVYLVDRKRTASKAGRNIIADNLVDAVKLALSKPERPRQQPVYIHSNKIQLGSNYAARA